MTNRAQRLLLMTSTIAPAAGVHALKRSDPQERLKDYQRALSFYLDVLAQGDLDAIVYVDNSAHDLSTLQEMATKRGLQDQVEFISYASDVSPRNNRLCLEAHLIEHFLSHSAILRSNPNATVWKVTGRYIIKNFRQIARRCEARAQHDICVNLRDYPYPVVDFYLIRFQVPAYRRLISGHLKEFEGLDDGEKTLRRIIDETSDVDILRRLPAVPRLYGIRGWDGAPYGGFVDSLKYYVRAACDVLLPSVRI